MYLSPANSIIKEMKTRSFSRYADLLVRVSAGDELAFKQIYEYYFPVITAVACRFLNDEEQAMEVAQEVMLVLWQKGEALSGIQNLDAFLKTLAKRRTIDALRMQIRRRTIERDLQTTWKGSSNETEERLAYMEVQQLVEKGLELLPPQQQKVFQLCQQQGFKYEEAARLLNIAPGTVQSHMKHALKFLRNYIRQRMDMAALLVFLMSAKNNALIYMFL